jgi:hypothetical protein
VLECLVVAEIVAQGLFHPGLRGKEPMVRGPAPQHFPEALKDLQLRTVAGQSVQLELWQLVEDGNAFDAIEVGSQLGIRPMGAVQSTARGALPDPRADFRRQAGIRGARPAARWMVSPSKPSAR